VRHLCSNKAILSHSFFASITVSIALLEFEYIRYDCNLKSCFYNRFATQEPSNRREASLLISISQISTIQTGRLDQQQHAGGGQSNQLSIANQGIKTSNQLVIENTDLPLALIRVVTNAATQEHAQDVRGLMLKVMKPISKFTTWS